MKIALNLQPCMGNRSGVGTFTHEIAKRLRNEESELYRGNLFDFRGCQYNTEFLEEYGFPVDVCKLMPYGVYRRIWKLPVLKYENFFPKADVYHFFNYIIPPHIDGIVITMVYDLVYLQHPETMGDKNLKCLKDGMEHTIERSDMIITISDAIRNELIEVLGVPEHKVRRIYLAASLSEEETSLDVLYEKYHIEDRPYFLFVGTIEPRKNLARVIQAFNRVKEETGSEHQLILAGGKGWSNESIYEEAKQSPYSKDIIFTGYISEEDKAALYRNADIFLFPSIYEGFGIPLLEAMEAGVPVVTSNVSSMPEVVGDGGQLVDPMDVESIAEGILEILEDDAYREALIGRGYLRSQEFSWEKSAKQLEEIYKEINV